MNVNNLTKITNKYGFTQFIDMEGYATCPNCNVLVDVNTGQGTDCYKCQESYLTEFEHDYDNGDL